MSGSGVESRKLAPHLGPSASFRGCLFCGEGAVYRLLRGRFSCVEGQETDFDGLSSGSGNGVIVRGLDPEIDHTIGSSSSIARRGLG